MFGFIGRFMWRFNYKQWTREAVEAYWKDCTSLSDLITKLSQDKFVWRGNYRWTDFNKSTQEFMARKDNNCGDWAEMSIDFLRYKQLADKIILVYAEKFNGNLWTYLWKPQWHFMTIYLSGGSWWLQENASVSLLGAPENDPKDKICGLLARSEYNRVEFMDVI